MDFSLFGCRIKISFWFLSFLTGIMMVDKSGELIFGVFSALCHEFGHIFGLILQGDKPNEVRVGLFDIAIIDNKRSKRNFSKDLFILILGPVTNFIIALLFYGIFFFSRVNVFYIFAYQNLILGLLNALPIESLDGGQITYIILLKFLSEKKARNLVSIISFIILIPLLIVGFYILLQSRYNFSLLLISLYLISVLLMKNNIFY